MIDMVKEISGLIVPLLTPMNEDLSVDRIALKALTARLMNKGVRNFFVLSPLGEQQFLDFQKEKEVIKVVFETLHNRGNLLIGCFGNSNDEIIEKVRFAERFTKKCVVNVPFPALSNEIMFVDFFDALFTQTKSEIVLCNDPFAFHRNIPIIGLDRIANWEKLVGIIDYSNNWGYFKALSEYHQSLKIFQGIEDVALESVGENCSGFAVGLANIFPGYFENISSDLQKLGLNEMLRRQARINSLLRENFPKEKRIQFLKIVLSIEGVMQSFHSKELFPIDVFERKKIEQFLERSFA
jgi:4-hydroxy-tetrahydrodipicolinate synthase